jgi:hypothetical protein
LSDCYKMRLCDVSGLAMQPQSLLPPPHVSNASVPGGAHHSEDNEQIQPTDLLESTQFLNQKFRVINRLQKRLDQRAEAEKRKVNVPAYEYQHLLVCIDAYLLGTFYALMELSQAVHTQLNSIEGSAELDFSTRVKSEQNGPNANAFGSAGVGVDVGVSVGAGASAGAGAAGPSTGLTNLSLLCGAALLAEGSSEVTQQSTKGIEVGKYDKESSHLQQLNQLPTQQTCLGTQLLGLDKPSYLLLLPPSPPFSNGVHGVKGLVEQRQQQQQQQSQSPPQQQLSQEVLSAAEVNGSTGKEIGVVSDSSTNSLNSHNCSTAAPTPSSSSLSLSAPATAPAPSAAAPVANMLPTILTMGAYGPGERDPRGPEELPPPSLRSLADAFRLPATLENISAKMAVLHPLRTTLLPRNIGKVAGVEASVDLVSMSLDMLLTSVRLLLRRFAYCEVGARKRRRDSADKFHPYPSDGSGAGAEGEGGGTGAGEGYDNYSEGEGGDSFGSDSGCEGEDGLGEGKRVSSSKLRRLTSSAGVDIISTSIPLPLPLLVPLGGTTSKGGGREITVKVDTSTTGSTGSLSSSQAQLNNCKSPEASFNGAGQALKFLLAAYRDAENAGSVARRGDNEGEARRCSKCKVLFEVQPKNDSFSASGCCFNCALGLTPVSLVAQSHGGATMSMMPMMPMTSMPMMPMTGLVQVPVPVPEMRYGYGYGCSGEPGGRAPTHQPVSSVSRRVDSRVGGGDVGGDGTSQGVDYAQSSSSNNSHSRMLGPTGVATVPSLPSTLYERYYHGNADNRSVAVLPQFRGTR